MKKPSRRSPKRSPILFTAWISVLLLHGASLQAQLIEGGLVHIRSGETREWSDFPEECSKQRLEISFEASRNTSEGTLLMHQEDVKNGWRVILNDNVLGELVRDENPMEIQFSIAAGLLREGPNSFNIEPTGTGAAPSDDIRIGKIRLLPASPNQYLHECRVKIQLRDESTKCVIPGRITIVNAAGELPPLGALSTATFAARNGLLYTATGEAEFGLPAGTYTFFAGRGFEYSLDRKEIDLRAGDEIDLSMSIQREVETTGYVACDTHIHTFTYSRHGDASIQERMMTLAGEGIELPIATDHNHQVNYEPFARQMHLRSYFTPVTGNEVTTTVCHQNIFPVPFEATLPNAKLKTWNSIIDDIDRTTAAPIVILNHARDKHNHFCPFGPAHYNSVVAENLDGWPIRFNGMEIVNSGATQTDPLQLIQDWMGLLNAGYRITPVGSSDSHDVARYIVGQSRTYIRCDDSNPGEIDVSEAVEAFRQGRVCVSYGLFTELTVVSGQQHWRSGELVKLAPDENEIFVEARILGPHWAHANRLLLFANGQIIQDERITEDSRHDPGVLAKVRWPLPRPQHDLTLVAVARGPGIEKLYWPTAKPYQPDTIDPSTSTIGCSGAIFIDADTRRGWTSPRASAEAIFRESGGKLASAVPRLKNFDAAVAAHVAHLYLVAGGSPRSEEFEATLHSEIPAARQGFQAYLKSRTENDMARTSTPSK